MNFKDLGLSEDKAALAYALDNGLKKGYENEF